MNNSDPYTDDINKIIAKNIKGIRLKKGLTIEELAEAANLSAPYISRIENGKATCSALTIIKLAYGLGIRSVLLISEAEKTYSELRDKEKE